MDQRDLDGSPLEPEDLTGDDPSISETPRAGVEEADKGVGSNFLSQAK